MHLYQTDIWVRYARRGKPQNPKEVGHPFPILCMFHLSDEIQFHGNIRYERNGCFGQPPSVALSSQIKHRHNPEQLQKDTNKIEKPGHSIVSAQVEWV
jgi:hypothetical protein